MAEATATPPAFGAAGAEVYERNMGRWSRRLAPLLLDFVGDEALPDGAEILDLGCGTGSLTSALAARHPAARITGCDIAAPLLAHARAANPAPGRVGFEHGDASALPFPNGRFDQVLSSLVLMFLPDAGAALREMRRVTRPGGLVAATTWDFRGGMPQLRLLADTVAALNPAGDAWRTRIMRGPGVLPGHLGEFWRQAGFREIRETSLAIRMEFADFADYWEPSSQSAMFGAFLRSLPPPLQADLQAKVRAAYLLGDADGPRSFTATAWAVVGRC